MARWKLRIEERAESEAREAYIWYLARSKHAAGRFQFAIEECMRAIADGPERFCLCARSPAVIGRSGAKKPLSGLPAK